MFFDV
jgi:tubulin beta